MKEVYRNPDYTEYEGNLISYVVHQLDNGLYQVEYYCKTEFFARSKFRIEKAVDWKDPCAVFNAGLGVLNSTVKGQVLINGKWTDMH